jgi:glycosyltransferase involved in cell wall biosynthesis
VSTPRVSCIIPVFNGERHLAEAVDSVLGQTEPAHEILAIDDGSTDGSAEVLARYGDRVRYVRKPHGGPASTRNHGVSIAAGEFVAFLDQDDRWHPAKLAWQLACFAEDPHLDLCFGHAELFWDPGLEDERDAYRDHARGTRVPAYSTPTLLARRSAFARVGPLDTDLLFGDATDWTLRAIDAGLKTRLLPETLLYHRMHASNLTRRREASKAEFVRIVRATLARRRAVARAKASPT